ncbi:MAG: M48 family metallopeptidase [Bacteroidales bacterium]|nr:M48 family metallopeptidase [Bacteroidales bacterium]
MTVSVLFYVIIAIIVVDYALERFLEYLNGTMRGVAMPAEVSDIYDEKLYEKQQKYELAKSRVSFWSSTVSFLFLISMFVFGGYGLLDSWLGTFGFGPIISGLLFFAVLTVISEILEMPFSWYNTFVIEEQFGFNKMTKKLFVIDEIKSFVVSIVVGGLLLSGLFFLVSWFGEQFWVLAWIAISVFLVFINMFYSTLFVPIFNKQTPLEEGELKEAIFAFSQKAGFMLDNIYVIDGSKRSTKANAYFSGFGPKKRVVLYDTLIQSLSVDEIVAVLAHEIGHYKKKHTLMMLAASVLQMGLLLFLFGLFLKEPSFSEVLGISFDPEKTYVSLFVFSILFTPISFFIGMVINVFVRRNEYQADEFAGRNYAPEHLENALKKLSKNSLSNLTPHPWYVFCYYSHPTLYQRIVALRTLKK